MKWGARLTGVAIYDEVTEFPTLCLFKLIGRLLGLFSLE